VPPGVLTLSMTWSRHLPNALASRSRETAPRDVLRARARAVQVLYHR